ncbi:hypothetical protein [Krasilnikovia sp. MM14-A1259]|uniref:hypothetical protein n=1 Tax=Krasilnikovia sp. MM14-A1259 TaxID=3373539 RepID=UPI00380E1FEF
MDVTADGARLAADLEARLADLSFTDADQHQVTAQIIDAAVAWAQEQGWRAYRRAASVVSLPAPMQHRQSVLDVACARPAAPPIAIEVDHSDRQRTVDKLLAEAQAGRVAIWIRWGPGRFAAPPAPVHLVTVAVTRRPGSRFSRSHAAELPPPRHSLDAPVAGDVQTLPLIADS